MSSSKNSVTKKQKANEETSESISLQIENFLSNGGQIETVDQGVSGVVPKTGKKHITITPKNAEA